MPVTAMGRPRCAVGEESSCKYADAGFVPLFFFGSPRLDSLLPDVSRQPCHHVCSILPHPEGTSCDFRHNGQSAKIPLLYASQFNYRAERPLLPAVDPA